MAAEENTGSMTDRIASAARVEEHARVTAEMFAARIAPVYRPAILRGLARDWPAVRAAKGGPAATASYLRRFAGGRPLHMFAAAPEANGRFFYDEDVRGFNFRSAQVLLPVLLDALLAEAGRPDPAAIYAGSAKTSEAYPGWAEENELPLSLPGASPRLWLGNATRASTHYDMSDNLAVVVAGRRRFVLFPPEQVANLYVGPLEHTVAGQPTSMVDLERPDLQRYPRFAEAARSMLLAELEPGDALFIPSLWWHDVRATGPLNVLVNYWWGQGAGGSPFAALLHAMLAIRDLPRGQRAALQSWFDHYIFAETAAAAGDHLPPDARGVLGAASPQRDEMMRQFLRRALDQES